MKKEGFVIAYFRAASQRSVNGLAEEKPISSHQALCVSNEYAFPPPFAQRKSVRKLTCSLGAAPEAAVLIRLSTSIPGKEVGR